jgi:hypothetical protein
MNKSIIKKMYKDFDFFCARMFWKKIVAIDWDTKVISYQYKWKLYIHKIVVKQEPQDIKIHSISRPTSESDKNFSKSDPDKSE